MTVELSTLLNKVDNISNNIIFVPSSGVKAENTCITFRNGHGTPNILYIESGVFLSNCQINFCGEGSIVFLKKSRHKHRLNISVYDHSVVFVGEDNYFNPFENCSLVASEGQNILLGNDGLFSGGCWLRTSDAHGLYDCVTKKRLNNGKSILIGNHVWMGQNCLVLKGAQIGSGSIVGGNSVVTGRCFPSNVSLAGNPARVIREGVFFSKRCVHHGDYEDKFALVDDKEMVFFGEEKDWRQEMDKQLLAQERAMDRLEILKVF